MIALVACWLQQSRPASRTSLNNKKISEIVSILFNKIGSDGGIISAKYKKLDERFHEYYCEFIEQPDKYTIE